MSAFSFFCPLLLFFCLRMVVLEKIGILGNRGTYKAAITKTPQSSKRSRKLRCRFRMGQTGNTKTKTSVVIFKTA